PQGGDSEGEITNKSQIPILNDQNRFGIWNFGHCDLFDICDFYSSNTPVAGWAAPNSLKKGPLFSGPCQFTSNYSI
ncbi:MAG: hypothetical protein OEV11_11070, partial [Deltaproteobacteria bacterium]|nr:hypothetical protein [Deltaproteobacteria bacterium]